MDLKTFKAVVTATPVPIIVIRYRLGWYDLSYQDSTGVLHSVTVSNPANKGELKIFRSLDTIINLLLNLKKEFDIRMDLPPINR